MFRVELETMYNLKYNKILFCGPSGSGKTTWAKTLKKVLGPDIKSVILDGDELRDTINNDLDFSFESVKENARRVTELSNWLTKYQGVNLVICSLIMQPEECRALFKENDFYVVFVENNNVEKEDLKGLYSSNKAKPWKPKPNDDTIDIIVDNNIKADTLASVCEFLSTNLKK